LAILPSRICLSWFQYVVIPDWWSVSWIMSTWNWSEQ
jgi:hypothetical protein